MNKEEKLSLGRILLRLLAAYIWLVGVWFALFHLFLFVGPGSASWDQYMYACILALTVVLVMALVGWVMNVIIKGTIDVPLYVGSILIVHSAILLHPLLLILLLLLIPYYLDKREGKKSLK